MTVERDRIGLCSFCQRRCHILKWRVFNGFNQRGLVNN